MTKNFYGSIEINVDFLTDIEQMQVFGDVINITGVRDPQIDIYKYKDDTVYSFIFDNISYSDANKIKTYLDNFILRWEDCIHNINIDDENDDFSYYHSRNYHNVEI